MTSNGKGTRQNLRSAAKNTKDDTKKEEFIDIQYLEDDEQENGPYHAHDHIKNDGNREQPNDGQMVDPTKKLKMTTSTPNAKSKKVPKSNCKNEAKSKLAAIIQKEDVIYNKNNKQHSNVHAVAAAWERVAKEMNLPVDECKVLHKSLKDAARYKQNKAAGKYGGSSDDVIDDDSGNASSEAVDSLALFLPTSNKYPRKPFTFGGGVSASQNKSSTSKATNGTISPNSSRNDDMFEDDELSRMIEQENKDHSPHYSLDDSNSSVYAYASKKKEKKPDIMETSVSEMSKALTGFISNQNNSDPAGTTSKPTLKFDYIWCNLDQLFQQMTLQQVNDLNFKFMNLAFEKLQENAKSDQQDA